MCISNLYYFAVLLSLQVFFFFKKDFIYLFMRDTEIGRGRSRLLKEPDAGLDPGTPGSRSEPKADA